MVSARVRACICEELRFDHVFQVFALRPRGNGDSFSFYLPKRRPSRSLPLHPPPNLTMTLFALKKMSFFFKQGAISTPCLPLDFQAHESRNSSNQLLCVFHSEQVLRVISVFFF